MTSSVRREGRKLDRQIRGWYMFSFVDQKTIY